MSGFQNCELLCRVPRLYFQLYLLDVPCDDNLQKLLFTCHAERWLLKKGAEMLQPLLSKMKRAMIASDGTYFLQGSITAETTVSIAAAAECWTRFRENTLLQNSWLRGAKCLCFVCLSVLEEADKKEREISSQDSLMMKCNNLACRHCDC